MKWLELIELRSTSSGVGRIEEQLANMPGLSETPGLELCRRTLIDGDFLLTICHQSGPVEMYGSKLGVRLAAALERHGLVNHSVWTVHDRDMEER